MMREHDMRYVVLEANSQSCPAEPLPSFTTGTGCFALGAVHMGDSQDPQLGTSKNTGAVGRD